MAYRLKTVKYQNSPRKILLQNENGPCPLLACANALLLRGVISLPSACIRNGVASIDDVVNILGERALKRAAAQAEAAQNATEWKEVSAKKEKSGSPSLKELGSAVYHHESHEHHINELLSLFPNLQYGMDVNPRFTKGPSGVEYTMNITAFDLLGVDLVHGWLLDPQDSKTFELVGGKSYNELVELVIHGTEAASGVERISAMIEEKEKILRSQMSSGGLSEESNESDEIEWVNVPEGKTGVIASKNEDQNIENDVIENDTSSDVPTLENENEHEDENGRNESTQNDVSGDVPSSPTGEKSEPDTRSLDDDDRIKIQKELEELRKEHHKQSALASDGSIVNAFLTSSGHQLTYHGLHELHNYLSEECLCVFFRNNHFATMTKHGGVLYLLVTDLGYANVSEVMWEKLDSINGDTELFDEFFVKPKPRESLTVADGPVLSPETLLAQRGRSEADYHLALQLSSSNGGRPRTRDEMDEEEGKLIAAATEASLKEWNGNGNSSTKVSNKEHTKSPTIASLEKESDSISPEDADRAMAVALHAQMNDNHESSEMLARRLQAEENRRAAASRQRRTASEGAMEPDRAARPGGTGSNCIIS
eukprot:CAMPEP_0197439334 /NCGR_PEP_ID=MMETSP1175-20131217/6100_1 /TAXON_ID=1003142 /ORGANISM="Triceratium dubium, Strain CCMP147" /LENGTH=595 /DNA_ID=CAMNT_0042969231 /DNA_START=171 /DNA_END=1958 /DNA_ORIENTATION=+